MIKPIQAAVIAAALAGPVGDAHASGVVPPSSGWTRWEVPAPPDMPRWCCTDGRTHGRDAAPESVCALDGGNDGYRQGERRDRADRTDHADNADSDARDGDVRIYAKFENGALIRLRTLTASCQVVADSPIRPQAPVSTNESVAFLLAQLKTAPRRLANDAIAALAAHAGTAAQDALVTIARSDGDDQRRKDALFWATQARGAEGFDLVAPYLSDDPDPHIRQHAAFALSQSHAKSPTALLIRAATSDRDHTVRSRSWFWLAQTRAPETEQAVRRALPNEVERSTREQMIFALSQLPADRAASALISVAEDKSLPREDRKKALFWMGQIKSDRSLEYLDRLLATK
jgi:hypothetical protein